MPISQIQSIVPNGSFPSQYGDANGVMHVSYVVFADGTEGTANSKSPTPPYRVGDSMEYAVDGQHQGVNKLKIKKPQQGGQQGGGYQQQRPSPPPANQSAGNGQQSRSAGGSSAPSIHPATVGLAIKEAVGIALAEGFKAHTPDFFPAVHEYAAELCRIAWKLEHGQMSPKAKQQQRPPAAPPQQAQQQQSQRPRPGPEGSAFPQDDLGTDSDVPF